MSHAVIRRKTLLFVVAAGLLSVAWSAAGQAEDTGVRRPFNAEAEAAAAPETAATPQEGPIPYKNLFSILREGGLLMVPLFACSFITLVFIFERVISLRRVRVIPAPFVKKFFHQLREGKLDRDGALELCQESSTAVADVFAAAVKKWGRPAVEVEQAIIDAQERAGNVLRRYLRLFNGVATISPLMGLLGTVLGMIRLFNAIATADAMGRTEMLAGGISEAMLTTAGGLSIAIPALCCYLLFVGRVERLLMDIDGLGQELVALISAEALQDHAKTARASRRPTAA